MFPIFHIQKAIDKDNDGSLTLEEFLDAYNRMAEILKRQDAMEQKKKLYCLIIYGPKQGVFFSCLPVNRNYVNQISYSIL